MTSVERLLTYFIPGHYNLSLDIDRKARTFSGTVTIQGVLQPSNTEIALHAKDLVIESAHIDGKQAKISQSDDTLRLSHDQLTPGEHIVVIGFNGKITDAMHGMYPCHYIHNDEARELIATQFESHHAREVFPCIDEPEAKAIFDVTLTTEPGITVLGNLHPVSQKEQNDRLVTTFGTTPRMSTYLLAWVYGDLHKKTGHTASGVEVNIYATPAQPSESLDFALDHAIKSIDFFDQYFGTAYPLPKSDHVALPDFSSGAMENWGLITYRESCLLADPKTTTLASKQYIATVISHELSHQWFGNLVTMKWWNNLWLNESFATLMEYVAVDAIHPEWSAWLDFATHESIMALRRDAVDGVQAVQVDVNHPDEISSLFDGAIVYAKGARLMKMCQSYIGDEAFQKGLRSYFAEFAYQNTESDDLWRHLSTASGKDIRNFMNTWISQSGYPMVTVSNDSVSQSQFFIGDHQPSSKIWPIPLFPESKEDLPELLETTKLSLPVSDSERLNIGDNAHFITNYTFDHLLNILDNTPLSDIDKLQLLHEQTLLIRAGHTPSSRLIDLLPKFADTASQHVWEIIAVAFAELKKFVENDAKAEDDLRTLAGSIAASQFHRLGWQPALGEPENDTKLRTTILGFMLYSQQADILAHADILYAQGVETLDPELRALILGNIVYRSTSLDTIRSLFSNYVQSQSPDLRDDLMSGLTSAKQNNHVQYIIDKLTDTKAIRPQDNARWFAYFIRNRHAREATWQWMRDNWQWIENQFAGDKSYDYYPRYAAGGLTTTKQRDEYHNFFSPLRDQPALTRVIDLGIREIDARIELLQRDGDEVRKKLASL